MVEDFAVEAIAGADADRLEAVEHVELGQRDAGDARYRDRLPHEDRVEPAAAALAPGDGAEFMAALAKLLPGRIVELGREGARSDARRIGLGDAEDETDRIGAETRSRRGGPGNGVRTGDERIGAVVDVEQHALRAFEQDALAARARLAERLPHRAGELEDEIGDLGEVVDQPLAIDRRFAEACTQRIVVRGQPVELGFEMVEMGKVANTDRAPADLVLVCRADAAQRRADLARAAGGFAQSVEIAVERQDQRAIVGDVQRLGRNRYALAAQFLDLGLERPRIEDDAVADDARRAAHDARRQ